MINFESYPGDVPSAPGMPTITKLRNSVYQLNWEPAQAHGSLVTLYCLEGKMNNDRVALKNNSWILYYNGTDNYWITTKAMLGQHRFRVQAKNAYGFGSWSKLSDIIDLSETTEGIFAPQQHLGLVLGLSVPVIAITLICFCYFFHCKYKTLTKQTIIFGC